MPRAKTVVPGRARRRKILKAAKGNFSGRRKLDKTALQTVQRAGQFAVPRHKRMQTTPAVAKLIAVISPFDDVQQPTGWPPVRIIIYREKVAVAIEFKGERIPEAGGEKLQFASIRFAAKDVSSLPASAVFRTIAAFQSVLASQILP